MKTAFVFLCLAAIAFAADSNPDENLGIVDPDLFEGDIVFPPEQQLAALNGDITGSTVRGAPIYNRKWTNGIVYYEIRQELQGTSAEGVIASAMREWESKTCIRFKRRQNEMNYVYFYKGKGCSSYVGMYGGGQPISLADGCWYHGTVAHEIGHALGFFHEQSRPDRDNYVTIMLDNIKSEAKFNFEKYTSSKINTMNTPYDYDSLMHYGSHYFSYNGKPTIVAKKGGATFGQRSFISDLDAHLMSMRYDCPAYKVEGFGCSYKASVAAHRCWKYCGTRGSGHWCWINKSCGTKSDCGTGDDLMAAQCYGKCG